MEKPVFLEVSDDLVEALENVRATRSAWLSKAQVGLYDKTATPDELDILHQTYNLAKEQLTCAVEDMAVLQGLISLAMTEPGIAERLDLMVKHNPEYAFDSGMRIVE